VVARSSFGDLGEDRPLRIVATPVAALAGRPMLNQLVGEPRLLDQLRLQ
jgi:hypothetical protein